jgi:RNA polymerase sigma-70 factor (ECF subfamily)
MHPFSDLSLSMNTEEPNQFPLEVISNSIFEEYHAAIFRYILRLVHHEKEAEDLTQETFLRAHQHLETLKDANAAKAWLYRIATNVCYDRFRQAEYKSEELELDPETSVSEDADSPGLELVIDQVEMSECIHRYIARLSDDYQLVILLHDLHGMTHAEIARRLGCSLEAVKIRLVRARQKLKTSLAAGCKFSTDERGVLTCDPKLSTTC